MDLSVLSLNPQAPVGGLEVELIQVKTLSSGQGWPCKGLGVSFHSCQSPRRGWDEPILPYQSRAPKNQSPEKPSWLHSDSGIMRRGRRLSQGRLRPYSWAVSGEGNGNPLQHSCLENPMDGGAWKAAVHGVARSQTRLSDFTFHFHGSEKEMATYSRVLAWRIPGTGEPGGLPSMGSHRVGHDWSDLAAAAAWAVSLLPSVRWMAWNCECEWLAGGGWRYPGLRSSTGLATPLSCDWWVHWQNGDGIGPWDFG